MSIIEESRSESLFESQREADWRYRDLNELGYIYAAPSINYAAEAAIDGTPYISTKPQFKPNDIIKTYNASKYHHSLIPERMHGWNGSQGC